MNTYPFSNPGVITGQENNKDLFIRKTNFPKGYSEDSFHNHPNSFEFYIILKGTVEFENEEKEISKASAGSIVYFEEAEFHRIVSVEEDVEMLLIKKLGSLKS